MSISIYYLRRFGLSYTLAESLSKDEVELLDLFLKKNNKLSELYTNKKIDKLKSFFKEALFSMSKSSNIFDEIFMLESCGINLGTSKIYEKSTSVNVNLNMSKKFKIKMYILFICLLEKIF